MTLGWPLTLYGKCQLWLFMHLYGVDYSGTFEVYDIKVGIYGKLNGDIHVPAVKDTQNELNLRWAIQNHWSSS